MGLLDLDIVDCHHHLWDLDAAYPWLQETAGELQVHGDDAAIRHDYLVADYRHDAGPLPLITSVHVDAGAADPLAEARWLQARADGEGLPGAVVAGASLADPQVVDHLQQLGELPAVRGVRDILNWHPDPGLSYIERADLITDPHWLQGFALLDRYGLSFDLQLDPHQLTQAPSSPRPTRRPGSCSITPGCRSTATPRR